MIRSNSGLINTHNWRALPEQIMYLTVCLKTSSSSTLNLARQNAGANDLSCGFLYHRTVLLCVSVCTEDKDKESKCVCVSSLHVCRHICRPYMRVDANTHTCTYVHVKI